MRKRIMDINGGTRVISTSQHPTTKEYIVTDCSLNQNNVCINVDTYSFRSAREAFKCYNGLH